MAFDTGSVRAQALAGGLREPFHHQVVGVLDEVVDELLGERAVEA